MNTEHVTDTSIAFSLTPANHESRIARGGTIGPVRTDRKNARSMTMEIDGQPAVYMLEFAGLMRRREMAGTRQEVCVRRQTWRDS